MVNSVRTVTTSIAAHRTDPLRSDQLLAYCHMHTRLSLSTALEPPPVPVATAAVRAAAARRRGRARGRDAGHEGLRLVPGRLEVAGRAARRDDAVVPLHRLPPVRAAAASMIDGHGGLSLYRL